jgi:hypothetical protein
MADGRPTCKQLREQAVTWHLLALGAKFGTHTA